MVSFVTFTNLAIFTKKWQLVNTMQLAGNDHVIDIFTNEDMENILLRGGSSKVFLRGCWVSGRVAECFFIIL